MHRDAFLFATLEALHVQVKYVELPGGRDGEYVDSLKIVRLRRGMSERLHRSVLAHETAHAVFGDVPSRFGPVNAKQERRADEWAAMRLINHDAYRHCERVHEGHAGAIAYDLGVVRSIVDAYRRVLLRVGDTTYINARMGAGQWDHRAKANHA